MESFLWVAVFWLSVLSGWLAWRVMVLRRSMRRLIDWQRLAMSALERTWAKPPEEEDDSILDSEVIQ